MSRKEFAARIWSKLALFERAHGLLRRGDRVLAAVSGGPDSVCLAHYLASQRRRRGMTLSLLHVHHGLRGKEADRDAEFVRRLGGALSAPVSVVKVPAAGRAAVRRKGLEDAGRELRYAALVKEARRLGCNKVATGHQLDDQAETVLLHLLRGTRLSALAGIPPSRRLARGLTVIRPLLPLRRTDVVAYLRIHGLGWRLDRSNLSTKFTRNWVRRRIIPALEGKNPRIREHLAGIAAQVRAIGTGLNYSAPLQRNQSPPRRGGL